MISRAMSFYLPVCKLLLARLCAKRLNAFSLLVTLAVVSACG